MYGVNIYVHQVDGPRFIVAGNAAARNIHLSYHGEYHYNSIRAIGDCGDGASEEVALDSGCSKSDTAKTEKDKATSYDWKKIGRALEEAKLAGQYLTCAEASISTRFTVEEMGGDFVDGIDLDKHSENERNQDERQVESSYVNMTDTKREKKVAAKKVVEAKLQSISKKVLIDFVIIFC